MSLQSLVELVRQSRELSLVGQSIRSGRSRGQIITGLSGSQRSLFLSTIHDPQRVMLVVTGSQNQAETLAQDLYTLLPGSRILLWEANELMPHEEALTALDLRASRLTVLQEGHKPGTIILTSIAALLEGLVAPDRMRNSELSLKWGSRLDLDGAAEQLVNLGYERVPTVENYGQFSIRGGILDIAPFNLPYPVRIELFGDEVDSLRSFDRVSQRSLENLQEVVIKPARETLYDLQQLERIKEAIWEAAQRQSERLHRLKLTEEADELLERTARHLEAFEQQRYFPGMDQYKVFFGEVVSLLEYLPQDTLLVLDEPVRLKEAAVQASMEIGEHFSQLLKRGRILSNLADLYWDWNSLWVKFQQYRPVYLSVLGKRVSGMETLSATALGLRMPEHFGGKIERMLRRVKQLRRDHYRILILVSSKERGQRILELLREDEVPAVYVDELGKELQVGNCVITTGTLETGFEYPAFKLSVLTELELYGRPRKKARAPKVQEGLRIAPHELREGDYVVHINHGIGQYMGIEQLEVDNRRKDYLLIRYAGQDRLYVPVDQIHLLQRYVGLDEGAPRLSKLGGNEWNRVKKRAKESVQEMAEGLLKLYAEREAAPGFAFPPDTPWQRELENSFPYQETPDQLQAIEAVKRDMERPRPMDRLLCGDVGYGKTEVAIRAAFKAVMGGKQVAVLVPTTILAQQHQRTFEDRFEGFPVNVGVVSRFQTQKEINKVLKGVKAGTVDVLIGTHRLLSKDVVFKDLGLVIVDEEQRFGVAQKERLKEITRNVDVLTLSATPIPRTLHMAMVGVRDMSVIETPPEDRYPVRTYVVEYDEQLIRQAILRELARQGQVYFVHNRVQSIEYVYSELQKLVPEARIAIAHGQMDEAALERVMLDFYNGEYDILLCTTIIETGMDIGNVNTLIVDEADHLGLAQLYQLRGRVGRTNRVAYAYFTHRKDKVLSEDAEKRLAAIREFTELGSGIRIAMRDLEIRGAGNLLGPEQHGFIASVGFELYCRLLEEAIQELKGEAKEELPDPFLDLKVDAYLASEYVPDPGQKVELYQRIANLSSLEQCDDLEEEIQDRFGDLPDAARNLLQSVRVKILARKAGVESITARRNKFELRFAEGKGIDVNKYAALYQKHPGKISYRAARGGQLLVEKLKADDQALDLLQQVLAEMANE
ncbi:MAG TPA: transcription-repair coupling factor [Limnochordia bacterium]|nr:transcription-repair coupling factor [Limnochordia bacterium]